MKILQSLTLPTALGTPKNVRIECEQHRLYLSITDDTRLLAMVRITSAHLALLTAAAAVDEGEAAVEEILAFNGGE